MTSSNLQPYDESYDPCYIDSLPDIEGWWDAEFDPYPGCAEATSQFLEDMNYHSFVYLPYAFEEIVTHTPLPAEDKLKLFKRLCNAVYNFDRLIRGAE